MGQCSSQGAWGMSCWYVCGRYIRTRDPPRGTAGVGAFLVCVFAHSVLSIFHTFSNELVDLVDVHDKVYGSQVHHFDVWEDGLQLRMAKEDTPVVIST